MKVGVHGPAGLGPKTVTRRHAPQAWPSCRVRIPAAGPAQRPPQGQQYRDRSSGDR